MAKDVPGTEGWPRRKRRVAPFLCSLVGTLILLAVIAAFVPLTAPHLLGYEDPMPVEYERLIGEVVYHLPFLGAAMAWLSGTTGKVYAAILAACGIMFHMLAGSLRRQE